jgi:hypothetical protein
MRDLKLRVPLDSSYAPHGATKSKVLFLLAIIISMIAILIPDISLAKAIKDPKRAAREEAQIEKFGDKVRREGDTLFLKTSSGLYISLINSPGCENYETCLYYEFVDYFKDVGFYVVQTILWEGGGVIMVSESDGKEYYVYDLPILSPDNKHIISIPQDVETGYEDDGVYVWRIDGHKLIPEFSHKPLEYAEYKFIRWRNNKSIELKKWLHSSEGLCSENRYMVVPVSLKKEDGDWKFYEDFSPDSVQCDDSR